MDKHRLGHLCEGFLSNVESEWPSLKYLGFGFYYAWILVCYSSDVLFSYATEPDGFSLQTMMYIISTFSLALMLIVAAIFRKQVSRLVANTLFVVIAACIATVGTVLVFWGSLESAGSAALPMFYVGCCVTGLGTAFVALRFGMLHSMMPSSKILLYVTGSFLIAGTLYFVIIGIPTILGIIFIALLPLIAALLTATFGRTVSRNAASTHGSGISKTEEAVYETQTDVAYGNIENNAYRKRAKNLPRGFFVNLIVTITIFSLIAGFYTGLGIEANANLGSNRVNTIAVFIVIVVAVILLVINCAVSRRFDLSRVYYPIIVFACFCIVIIPLFGGYNTIQYALIHSSYTLFILFVWCVLTHTAHWSHMGSTFVFGLGRGASAFGTAVGWTVAMLFGAAISENFTLMLTLSAVMVLILAAVSMIMLRESTLRIVFSWSDSTMDEDALDEVRADSVGAQSSEAKLDDFESTTDTNAGLEQFSSRFAQIAAKEDTWMHACYSIATEHGLTNREREVLLLLGRRLTIERIAEELCVSFNTAKSHVRHVYDKIGVHSRKELFDIIDRISQSE